MLLCFIISVKTLLGSNPGGGRGPPSGGNIKEINSIVGILSHICQRKTGVTDVKE